ncbi:MAG: acetyl/propionyl/methylcrotonyl-CoA carboxylase subunit alpha [Hyphomicrobiaceae bacterium]|nr:acetyl/propionyl/methylcrotonyl-CoA carboxylase subunit alpha [Hyphomicrobiaceae bacterium]
MHRKILIANRGEIARRIIRTARKLGIATVAVYSDADARALHVQEADEAVHIGPSPATDSYLRGDRIIAAAKATGADGIHPGYGFLAENADFAEAVGRAGVTFVGPSPAAMRALGGKAAAKEVAIAAGVPVVPGYQGDRQDAASLAVEARRIGYPVMIKAVAGGGGRGMRLVASEPELPELLASAQREAQAAFGDARVLIEKVVERPRHVEVQVFGDAHGNVVHMFERDCTLQRRNQKVIEEAPAPGMSPELRERMCGAAVKLAKAVGYEGAGTVEFLVEGGMPDAGARWYFIEMNTRLQVEHPVTEEITGLDLVEWQLRVASGEKLPLPQSGIRMSGHAIEARLCAEDPAKGFLPSVGPIHAFDTPEDEGLRIESGVGAGDVVSPFYDSMIAKLITCAPTRDAACERLIDALKCTAVAGPVTNQGFLAALLADPDVRAGDMDTGLIGRGIERFSARAARSPAVAHGVESWLDHLADDADEPSLATMAGLHSPWRVRDGFQLGARRQERRSVVVNGTLASFDVTWEPDGARVSGAEGRGEIHSYSEHRAAPGRLLVVADGFQTELALPEYDAAALEDGHAGDHVRAPINGKVARIFVTEGQAVVKGDRIAVVEAMKMEHVLHAGRDGTIAKVAASEGQQVNQGALIASLAEA